MTPRLPGVTPRQAKGTLNQIINGSGLTRDEFLALLK